MVAKAAQAAQSVSRERGIRMELAKNLMIILLTGILAENFILAKFYGICPFLGVSKTLSGASGMGLAVTFVMVGATAVTYPIYHGILVPLNITYLNTICFILIIAAFVQLVEMILKSLTCNSLDTAHTCSHRTFANDLYHSYLAC